MLQNVIYCNSKRSGKVSRLHRGDPDSLMFIRFHDDLGRRGTIRATTAELHSLSFNAVKKSKLVLAILIRRGMALLNAYIYIFNIS